MHSKIIVSFLFSLENIRAHFFRTVLSILGIVIGVAALVAILSLIDGMEQYAKDQITTTTSLKAIHIRPEPLRNDNGVTIRKESISIIDYYDFVRLRDSLPYRAKGRLYTSEGKEVYLTDNKMRAAALVRATYSLSGAPALIAGKVFDSTDVERKVPFAVVNEKLANALMKSTDIKDIVGKELILNDQKITIVGLTHTATGDNAGVYIPITLHDASALQRNPPGCLFEASDITDVPKIKEYLQSWIKKHKNADDFSIHTNELRVEQAAKGFRLFRIVMGLIVGLSVLVGGIGVMNVLLISVTERTTEIGIRKAVGANKRDIVVQFLSESITISTFGSIAGLIIGILATMAFIPIIKSLTNIPFQAAYTWNTFIVICIISILVGIVFGTYPAVRAARLNPADAIRKE